MKLSDTQKRVLEKIKSEPGKWHWAHELKCRMSTLYSLTDKGYLAYRNRLGFLWTPRICVEFKIKKEFVK